MLGMFYKYKNIGIHWATDAGKTTRERLEEMDRAREREEKRKRERGKNERQIISYMPQQ